MRYIAACESQAWHLHVWHPDDPEGTSRHVPYACRSWRHPGSCALWRGAQDFVRVSEAIAKFPRWTYLVLTFDQRKWKRLPDQYRAGLGMWARLRKRITRKYGRVEYIQTWERFTHGGTHVNILVHNDKIQAETENQRWRTWRKRWLKPHAVECGFGYVCYVKPMWGDGRGMAGYLTKLSQELTGAGKKNQIPYDAPPHFRRLRASVRLLPPVAKSDLTGKLVFSPLERWIYLREAGDGRRQRSTNSERGQHEANERHP